MKPGNVSPRHRLAMAQALRRLALLLEESPASVVHVSGGMVLGVESLNVTMTSDLVLRVVSPTVRCPGPSAAMGGKPAPTPPAMADGVTAEMIGEAMGTHLRVLQAGGLPSEAWRAALAGAFQATPKSAMRLANAATKALLPHLFGAQQMTTDQLVELMATRETVYQAIEAELKRARP